MTPIDGPAVDDIAPAIADRDSVETGARAPRPRAARGRRPALLPRDAAARSGGDPGHPLGTAKSRLHRSLAAMRAAIDGGRIPTASRRSPEGSPHDRRATVSTGELPELLERDRAAPRTPDYLDDLLRQTARTRQRPAWTFPERWLPMVAIRPVRPPSPRFPVRIVGDSSPSCSSPWSWARARVAGSQPHLPAPFGLARNGRVAYAAGGDIYTADPRPGAAKAVVTGPEPGPPSDLLPRWHFASHSSARWTTPAVRDRALRRQGRRCRFTQVTPDPVVAINSYTYFARWPGDPRLGKDSREPRPSWWRRPTGAPSGRWTSDRWKRSTRSTRHHDGREVIFVGGPLPGTQRRDRGRPVRRQARRQRARPIVAPTNLLMLGPDPRPMERRSHMTRSGPTTRPTQSRCSTSSSSSPPRRDTTDLRDLPGADDLERSRPGRTTAAAASSRAATGRSRRPDCPSTMVVVPVGRRS